MFINSKHTTGRVSVFRTDGNTLEMLSGATTGFTLKFWPLWDRSSPGKITEVIIHFENENQDKRTKNKKLSPLP